MVHFKRVDQHSILYIIEVNFCATVIISAWRFIWSLTRSVEKWNCSMLNKVTLRNFFLLFSLLLWVENWLNYFLGLLLYINRAVPFLYVQGSMKVLKGMRLLSNVNFQFWFQNVWFWGLRHLWKWDCKCELSRTVDDLRWIDRFLFTTKSWVLIC